MTHSKPTQANMILRYMRENGSITPWEAIKEFGCLRLGARIFELKKLGYPIKRRLVCGRNRYGEKVSYAEYSLAE